MSPPLPMYQRARLGIGYLPQEASIFRGLNVEDNIRSVLEVVEPDAEAARARSRCAARRVQHHAAAQVALDRAVGRRAPPRAKSPARSRAGRATCCSTSRSPASIRSRSATFRQLVRHLTYRGIGVLITDHNVRETLGLTDRAYIIYSGEVLMEGRAEDIVNNPDVRQALSGRGIPPLSCQELDISACFSGSLLANSAENTAPAPFSTPNFHMHKSCRWARNATHGTDHPTGIPPEPGARDDAAADASHQAAAALEPRSGGLCRGGAGEKPAARTRSATTTARRGRRRSRQATSGARSPDGEGPSEWMGEDSRHQPQRHRGRTRHPARQRVPGGRRLRRRLGAQRGCHRRAFGMGERRLRRPRGRRL